MYEVFVAGAKEGFEVGVRIVPFLVAILAAVGMLRGSGTIDSVDTATMALAQMPSDDGLGGENMWLVLPTYPIVPGASFDAVLRAHTGDGGAAYALNVWIVQISMPAGLGFASATSVISTLSLGLAASSGTLKTSTSSFLRSDDVAASKWTLGKELRTLHQDADCTSDEIIICSVISPFGCLI